MKNKNKMKAQQICVVAENYPTSESPVFTFVAQLCNAIADVGVGVTVVAPQSIVKVLLGRAIKHPKKRIEMSKAASVVIYQPWCLSFGSRFQKLNAFFRKRAIERCVRNNKISPDVYYAHFWHTGYSIYNIAKKQQKPLVVATGESEISFVKDSPQKQAFCDYVKGVICVSTKNKNESIQKGLTTAERCVVIPNAIDAKLFKLMDKKGCREMLGLPQDTFVVAFVGWFNERKGSLRVSNALSILESRGKKVQSLFIGSGDQKPNCPGIVFCDKVSHDALPTYLNAADVFVLPTLKEGCCNAIIEAMACGLPIISSDLDFNHDVLNEHNAILVDPMNEEDIATAIEQLYDNHSELSQKRECAVATAKELQIDRRAARILDFIRQ